MDDLSALKQTDTGFVSLSLSHEQLKHTSQEAYEAYSHDPPHSGETPSAQGTVYLTHRAEALLGISLLFLWIFRF